MEKRYTFFEKEPRRGGGKSDAVESDQKAQNRRSVAFIKNWTRKKSMGSKNREWHAKKGSSSIGKGQEGGGMSKRRAKSAQKGGTLYTSWGGGVRTLKKGNQES